MPIDSGIYSLSKPVQMPDYLDSAQKAAQIGSSQMGQAHMMQQMKQADVEAKRLAHLQKASDFGNALSSLSTLSEPERAAAYPKVRAELLSQGVVPPEQMPEQYDPGFYGSTLKRFMQTKEGIDQQLKMAQVGDVKAQTAERYANAAKHRKDAGDGKILPAGEAAKIGNFIGAVDASKKIESLGADVPTGKWEAVKDWGKGMLGIQDQGRAKSLADVASQRNEVMSRIAGANVTPDEKSRILEGIPNSTDAPDSFTGKSRSTTDQLLGKAEAEIAALEAAGYNTQNLRAGLEAKKQEIMGGRQARDASKPKGSGGIVNSAVAGESAPSGPPAGMIRMQAPDGSIRLIPASAKGEAIAAGGKVVK